MRLVTPRSRLQYLASSNIAVAENAKRFPENRAGRSCVEHCGPTVAWSVIPAMIVCVITITNPSFAKDIHMIAPVIPPHFDDFGKGRIGDVIARALGECGHRVRFTMVPFGRHWKDYTDDDSYDGLATAEADQTFPGHTTIPFIYLQDGAAVLAGSGLEDIQSVEELAGKRVVAFPNADRILGIEDLVPKFESFRTRANRFDQIRPLLSGRTDAILADGLITAHILGDLNAKERAGLEPDVDTTKMVVFRRIFDPGPQRLYFREETISKDFDKCVAVLMKSGEMMKITKPYVDRYRHMVGDQYPEF